VFSFSKVLSGEFCKDVRATIASVALDGKNRARQPKTCWASWLDVYCDWYVALSHGIALAAGKVVTGHAVGSSVSRGAVA